MRLSWRELDVVIAAITLNVVRYVSSTSKVNGLRPNDLDARLVFACDSHVNRG